MADEQKVEEREIDGVLWLRSSDVIYHVAQALAEKDAALSAAQEEIARLKADHAADLAEHWVPRFDLLTREREAFVAGHAAGIRSLRDWHTAFADYCAQREAKGVNFSSQSETPEG